MQEEKTWKRQCPGFHFKVFFWAVYKPEIWVSWKSTDAFSGNPGKGARTEAFLGLSLFVLPNIPPLSSWEIGLCYPSLSGMATAHCTGLIAITAGFHHGHGLGLTSQICKTDLASNPQEQHWTPSAACHWIFHPSEDKLFQYQESGKSKGAKERFEQKANKSFFEAVPADSLGKMFLV